MKLRRRHSNNKRKDENDRQEAKCVYCQSEESDCGDKSHYGFECTRERGHFGSHVACGTERHDFAGWIHSGPPRA